MQPALQDLGKRIRGERLGRKLTLEALSQRTGLSKSFLSQVERGLTEPSITSLKKIAKEFGFSVVRLFSDDAPGDVQWTYGGGPIPAAAAGTRPYITVPEVVRADKRKRFALPGSQVIYDLLTPDMNRHLEIMAMRVEKGQDSGREPMVDPPGEKVGIVLQGRLEITVGGEVFQLAEGDTIYYPAHVPHSWRAVDGDCVEVIWVLTPPSF